MRVDGAVLDFGSGAGGAAVGYHRAGFPRIIGVDLHPQPHFPFEFIQADALEVAETLASGGCWRLPLGQRRPGFRCLDIEQVQLVHASMPCQRWTRQLTCRPGRNEEWPDLVTPLRPFLLQLAQMGVPYIMENVEGSPLLDPITLCGVMFDREIYRHRLIESSLPLTAPHHPPHLVKASRAGHWEPGTFISVAGHCAPVWKVYQEMDIDWMVREEVREAVPPYMTEYVGRQAARLLAEAA